ncbi:hypothetical protein MHK_008060 [Candidatus Magnetomorum sp. HK-1]|nr:hypothetical protein MHK_008060 [Candidatus Magnetomorum sp. HK-1]
MTIDVVFTNIIRVSKNLCDWTRYTNVKDKFSIIKAIIQHASSNDKVVQTINEQRSEKELRIDSPHYRGQPRAVFTVINSKSDKKNAVLMKSTLESIKTITQGAMGSAMGAGLVEIFKRVGMMII